MGGFSICKLVKPIKTVCSWTPHQAGVDHLLLAKTKSHIRTAAARVLGKADATMGQKLCRLDSLDRVPYQTTELLALLVGNGCSQVLNLHQPFANEYDLSELGNPSHPGVADELWIQREQPLRLLRVSAFR